jgi:NADH-quinone oxidoreductase subunit J
MQDALFYIFAAFALVCALLVVANPFSRNPVTSAMFLVLNIASLAGLFLLLNAYFLAAVQVLVYAGAVMVLFLFVIMLLDLRDEVRPHTRSWTVKLAGTAGILAVGAILWFLLGSVRSSHFAPAATPGIEGSTVLLGQLLFTRYLLPFEIVSVLLLVAMVGVILLSKKDLR